MTPTSNQIDKAASKKKASSNRPTPDNAACAQKTTKLDLMVAKLKRKNGATIADLMAITGWQAHSIRGALAGALKKKGHVILSEKIDGQRHYRIGAAT